MSRLRCAREFLAFAAPAMFVGACGGQSAPTLPPNQPPTATFVLSPVLGDTATVFIFDASRCSDDRDSTATLTFQWDFGQDGTWDVFRVGDPTATHRFGTPGRHLIRLVVLDSEQKQGSMVRSVQVRERLASPVAAFTVTPRVGLRTTKFRFDPSATRDADDAAADLTCRWDWEDDGAWDLETAGLSPVEHEYAAGGLHAVRLRVTDPGGAFDEAVDAVTVALAPPIVRLTVTPERGFPSTRFLFDPSGTVDEDHAPAELQCRWDWENDGTWDAETPGLAPVEHVFSAPGEYTVRLRVTDLSGAAGEALAAVKVLPAGPVAAFTVTPQTGEPFTVFEADASASFHQTLPAEDLRFLWDWEDDGAWDTFLLESPRATHVFRKVGSFTIRLQVRDPEGVRSDARFAVRVLGPSESRIRTLNDLGYRMAVDGDLLAGRVGWGVRHASARNGNRETLYGTVTETGTAAGVTWSPGPPDRLWIRPLAGPALSVRFLAWNAVASYVGDDPPRGHDIEGSFEVEVDLQERGFLTIAQEATRVDGGRGFNRTLSGSLMLDGRSWDVDLTHAGVTLMYPHGEAMNHTLTGSMSARPEQLRINEAWDLYSGFALSGSHWAGWTWRRTNRLSFPGGFLEVSGLEVHGEVSSSNLYLPARVTSPASWYARGGLLWNDVLLGEVVFGAPVIAGEPAPDAVVRYADGTTVVMQPHRYPTWDTPFSYPTGW